MIVAAETNFVLDLAFRQDEAPECERLIELAADRSIELVIPACSLFEPYETLVRRSKQRDSLLAAFKREVEELARSDFYADLPQTAEDIVKPIAGSSNVYENSLRNAIVSVLRVATIAPLSPNVMRQSFEFREAWGISSQDAIVAASVALFMRERPGGPKLFANRNLKDFLTPAVVAHFRECDCRLLSNFTSARHLTEASLQRRPH
jgi:predicted nucleic acid-binding protein